MARALGIDLDGSTLRVALLQLTGRRFYVEQTRELPLDAAGSFDEALRSLVAPLVEHGESFATALEGTQVLAHRIELPKTAVKQLEEVLPYELEALVPIDIDELVYDHHLLRRQGVEGAPVLAVCAKTEWVKSHIERISTSLGREPERVGAGAAPLANLVTVSEGLKDQPVVCLISLGFSRTEVVVVVSGELVFFRTISQGVGGLPENAKSLTSELRQTLLAWATQGGPPVTEVYLTGSGALTPQAEEYLSNGLGLPVSVMQPLSVTNEPTERQGLHAFAKAIGLAAGVLTKPLDFDLRKGPLSYQSGYGFLKEKVPLLVGFGVAIAVSFVFSMGASLYTLSLERDSLSANLGRVSAAILGQESEDPEEALELLNKAKEQDEVEPLPAMDAYDVLLELARSVPKSITHDIESFDMQRGRVRLNGVLGTADEAQQVLTNLKENRCVREATVSKITQAVNSDRKKYVLEFDVDCSEEKKGKSKAQTAGEAKVSEGMP